MLIKRVELNGNVLEIWKKKDVAGGYIVHVDYADLDEISSFTPTRDDALELAIDFMNEMNFNNGIHTLQDIYNHVEGTYSEDTTIQRLERMRVMAERMNIKN